MPGKIFVKGRKLTYHVAHFTPDGQPGPSDTLALTSYGDFKPGQYDTVTTQIKVGFSYDGHSQPNNSLPGSFAGVIETDSLLWSHPPRRDQYAILELSPFPYVKLPAASGRQWTWELGVGHQWGNPQWATWRGEMLVRSTYRITGQRAVQTKLGLLTCWVIQARATCPRGVSSLEALYHPRYGFVQLNYRNLNGSRMEFALIADAMEPNRDPFEPPDYLLPSPH